MRILVLSDTHGALGRAYEIAGKLEDIDLLVHLGDFYDDAAAIAKRMGVDYVAVHGNCDGAMRTKDTEYILETEYGRIYLTHGHTLGVYGNNVDRLMEKCWEHECKAAFFGHTHAALNYEDLGLRFVNPGSLSRPRDGSSGSYAIVTVEKNIFGCSIMYYNPGGSRGVGSGGAGNRGGRKKGGFLRNLLNNSDRF